MSSAMAKPGEQGPIEAIETRVDDVGQTVEDAASRLEERLRGAERHRLLMVFFICSESVFFLSLIIAYITYHGASGTRPGDVLSVPRTGLFSLALFASSGTLALAERAHRRRQGGRLRLWLLATIALGIVFLLGQALEWRGLLAQGVTLSRDLFGTTFFTLTGFHGLHVIVGLLALATVTAVGFAGELDGGDEAAIGTVSLYWHFVDAVWVIIFSVIYLWTLL
jgi:heme/copper-type cytochrome/quinol oxidase subunit 3